MLIPLATTQPQTDWRFICAWTGASLLAVSVSFGLMLAGLGTLLNYASPLVFGAAVGALFGFTSGLAQWLVLRRRLDGGFGWVLVTGLAWMLFWSLNMTGVFGHGEGMVGKLLEGVVHGLVFGAALGSAQWVVLRTGVAAAQRWIVISMFAWAVSAAAGDTIKAALGLNGPIEMLIALPLGLILTGIGMSVLLADYDYYLPSQSAS